MQTRIGICLPFLLLLIALIPNFTASQILFQGFNWASSTKEGGWWNFFRNSVPQLASAGITHVWLPPASQSGSDGPQGYLPGRLYDLDTSKYGNKNELKALVKDLKDKGIECIADIVINHRSGEKQDASGKFCIFEGGTPDARLDWDASFICSDDDVCAGKGKPDTGISWGKVPDIDHTNPKVQSDLSDWMNWLKTEVGFVGFRFDMVLGYGPAYSKIYMQNTKPSFAVAEHWNRTNDNNSEAQRREIASWIDAAGGEFKAFDFPTKGVLQAALRDKALGRMKDSNGGAPGLIGLKPGNAVTFIDNHDTYSQDLWPFPREQVMQGYVYILTHPGVPTVFYDHFFEWNLTHISNLIAIRSKNGIKPTSSLRILAADPDRYIAAIDEKVIAKIGPSDDVGNLIPSNFKLVLSGEHYAVWEKQA